VTEPEERLDLARAALAIALPGYPRLDADLWIEKIRTLAARVERRAGGERNAFRLVAAVNLVLFADEGFRGNSDDYYDPRNSFLNEVIDRKAGIPITLSVLYMEVARRAGLALQGVGFPGHFLVKCPAEEAADVLVIDPFHRGEVTPAGEFPSWVRERYGERLPFHPGLLDAVSKRQILQRILNNLKAIYLKQADYQSCLGVVERLLILDPGSLSELRDRGLLYFRLECFSQALADLERYLRAAPDAKDAETVRDQALRLRRLVQGMH
jgi:regulator of sirC expression with transglutaminase-like and TPR domain